MKLEKNTKNKTLLDQGNKRLFLTFSFIIVLLFLTSILLLPVHAEQTTTTNQLPSQLASKQIIINSNNWADVYSIYLRQQLEQNNPQEEQLFKGKDIHYILPEEEQKAIYELKGIAPTTEETEIYESKKPIIARAKNKLKKEGYRIIATRTEKNYNTALDIKTKKYYVIWEEEAKLSTLLIPFAKKENAWVFIANKENIKTITKRLNEAKKEGGQIVLVGTLPDSLKNKIQTSITQEIRGATKQEIVQELIKETNYSITNILIEDNTGIQEEYFQTNAIILPLKETYLDQKTKEFLQKAREQTTQSQSLPTITLTNKKYLPLAKQIRDATNSTVFVELGQSRIEREVEQNAVVRTPNAELRKQNSDFRTQNAERETQDAVLQDIYEYPLPSADIQLKINELNYYKETKTLTINIENKGTSPTYLRANIRILDKNNEAQYTYGTNTTEFIPGESTKTLFLKGELPEELIDEARQNNNQLEGEIYIIYGQEKNELDNTLLSKEGKHYLKKTITLQETNQDILLLKVKDANYRSDKKAFELVVINPQEEELEGTLEVQNIYAQGKQRDFGITTTLQPERTTLYIPAQLENEDYDKNKNISLHIQYWNPKTKFIHRLHINKPFFVFSIIPILIAIIASILGISIFETHRRKQHKKLRKAGIRWAKKRT